MGTDMERGFCYDGNRYVINVEPIWNQDKWYFYWSRVVCEREGGGKIGT